jgi:hypothetical protein
MHRYLAIILFAASLQAGDSAPGPVIGFWGDGSGIHPKSDPPVRWDSDTGLNILWHSPTPTFGYGAPIVLKDVVIAVTDVDSLNPWPLVIGYDLATGAEKWRQQIKPLDKTKNINPIKKGL